MSPSSDWPTASREVSPFGARQLVVAKERRYRLTGASFCLEVADQELPGERRIAAVSRLDSAETWGQRSLSACAFGIKERPDHRNYMRVRAPGAGEGRTRVTAHDVTVEELERIAGLRELRSLMAKHGALAFDRPRKSRSAAPAAGSTNSSWYSTRPTVRASSPCSPVRGVAGARVRQAIRFVARNV